MLEVARVSVEAEEVALAGTVDSLFDFLDNNGGLTEEFLYQHQPSGNDVMNVYATHPRPIGRLDRSVAERFGMSVLDGPVVVVARKGYAGRLFVVTDDSLVVQEDAYAIRPKEEFRSQISLEWFAAHYTQEFQALRTSDEGIGDFPRTLLRGRRVSFPTLETQARIASLYARRDRLVLDLQGLGGRVQEMILHQARH